MGKQMVGSFQQRQLDPFVESVGRTVADHSLIEPGQTVLVSVSGGADSVALLSVLVGLTRGGLEAKLVVGHLDHALRAESANDAVFVGELARQMGLDFISRRRDVGADARQAGLGIEQAARTARYEFFRAAAGEAGADRVAVGHHADDNVETILYRIARGTHIRGLAGIPIRRPLGADGMELIRPLLERRRSEIEQYLQRTHLAWRVDHTNADVQYRRNFIRHEVLPGLRDGLNSRVDEALLRLGAAAGQVEDLIVSLAVAALDEAARPDAAGANQIALAAERLGRDHVLVRTYAIRAALERLGAPMGSVGAERFAELDALVTDPAGGAVALPGGFVVRRAGELLIVGKQVKLPGQAAWAIALSRPGRTELPGGAAVVCTVAPIDRDAFAAHCRQPKPGQEWLDADQVSGELTCRPRGRGDAFWPLGGPGTQTVGDLLTNAKVPADQRRQVRCICDRLGIVYLAPLRIDQRVRVTDKTERVLRLSVE